MSKNEKNITIKLKPMRLRVALGRPSIIIEYIKTKPLVILLNILIVVLLFYLSPFLGFVGLIIEIILLFLIPSSKERTKEITHL